MLTFTSVSICIIIISVLWLLLKPKMESYVGVSRYSTKNLMVPSYEPRGLYWYDPFLSPFNYNSWWYYPYRYNPYNWL